MVIDECVEAAVVDGAQSATLRRVDAELLTQMPPERHRNLPVESSVCLERDANNVRANSYQSGP